MASIGRVSVNTLSHTIDIAKLKGVLFLKYNRRIHRTVVARAQISSRSVSRNRRKLNLVYLKRGQAIRNVFLLKIIFVSLLATENEI